MDVLIVGAGDVGRWFADLLDADVAFTDLDPVAADAAATAVGGGARPIPLDSDERADVVCVAVPLPAAVEAIETHAHRAGEAVVDVTGAMADPLAAMARAAPDRERLSLHPLFAPDAAPGTVAAASGKAGETTADLLAAVEAAGNDVAEVDPSDHDEAMRTVQAGAHAAVLAFGLAAEDVPPELATPVYEDLRALVDRVTGGNPRVYADIQATFDGAEAVADAAARIAAADRDAFEALYEDAR